MIFDSPDMQGERAMLEPATPLKRNWLYGWIIAAVVIVGCLAGMRAWGAERLGRYEIVLFYKGVDYDNVTRTFRTLGESFDTKTDCDIAIVRVKVLVSGARLVCHPVEEMVVR